MKTTNVANLIGDCRFRPTKLQGKASLSGALGSASFYDQLTNETVRIVGPGFIAGWHEVEKRDGDTYMARWGDLLKICHKCGARLAHSPNGKGADAFQGCDCSQPEWMAHE